jgi:hypothetical protein
VIVGVREEGSTVGRGGGVEGIEEGDAGSEELTEAGK